MRGTRIACFLGMKARRIECTAVFHDRAGMEAAIRSLLDNGMPPNRIRIERGIVRGQRDRRVTRPNRVGLLALGVAIGAMTGAALTLVWLLWLSSVVGAPLPLIVHRTADAAASGGITGALFAVFVLAAHRKDRYELDTKPDFLVTVKPPNAAVAEDVWGLLAFRGGDLVLSDETHARALPSAAGYRCGCPPFFAGSVAARRAEC